MSDPEADRIDGTPHPRDTNQLFGQSPAEAQFLEAVDSGRLHSGWMLTGPRGVGKATLAYRMAAALLALPPEGDMFGAPAAPQTLDMDAEHPVRRQIIAGSHPGLKVLRREMNDSGSALSADIRVGQLRGLKQFFHLSATDGGHRVVIIDAADELNPAAANAVLKELEEPPARTTLLLVTHQPSRLLPTIRSRCRELRLTPLGPEDMAQALAQADVTAEQTEQITTLAQGSVGDAVRLVQLEGLELYAQLVNLLAEAPQLDRPATIALADKLGARGAEARLTLLTDLLDILLARLARAGLMGPPDLQAAPGEARMLARLAPTDVAARKWAGLAQDIRARLGHGRAVNIDPSTLVLDALTRIASAAG